MKPRRIAVTARDRSSWFRVPWRGSIARSYPVAALLLLITAVPLVGAALFATQAVAQARRDHAQAESVERDVNELVTFAELQTCLLNERNWTLAAGGMAELGLSGDTVESLTGIDVHREVETAVEQCDALIHDHELQNAGRRLYEIRSAPTDDLVALGNRYSDLEADVAAIAAARSVETRRSAAAVSGDSALGLRLQALDAASLARRAMAVEFKLYFDVKFTAPRGRLENRNSLAGERRAHELAMTELELLVDPDGSAIGSLRRLESSEPVARFDAAIDGLLADPMIMDTDGRLELVLTDLAGVADVLDASKLAAGEYLELVQSAGSDVRASAAAASAGAERRQAHARGALVGLLLLSLAVAAAATRLLARPIRQLAHAARVLGDAPARDLAHLGQRGPRELREASRAMIDAATHLEVAERQALALAAGDLSHVALDERGTGRLGESLHTAVGVLASSIRDREDLRRSLEHEATHDPLTGLANRSGIMRHLSRLARDGTSAGAQVCVMFIDLDGFKLVNDRLGHDAGDSVLRVLANRLAEAAGPKSRVGRFGGDEFLAIAEVDDERAARMVAEDLRSVVATPVEVYGTVVQVTASIGVAVGGSSSAVAGELVQNADTAAGIAKRAGKNRVEVCDESMRHELRCRATLQRDLARAIAEGELTLHYQAIVDGYTESVKGFEALVRWHRPDGELMYPDRFVAIAERSELILALDRWVIDAAVRQLAAWSHDPGRAHHRIHVNVSGRHVSTTDFVDDVIRPLRRHGVAPGRLVVEITENALLDDVDLAARHLREIRGHGVGVAIDDFGTGFTSLTQLRALPIDILKIDRSFVVDRDVTSLVRLIIETGHLLGVEVTAEGIETAEDADRMVALGVDHLQGYHYGRPAPPSGVQGAMPRPVRRLRQVLAASRVLTPAVAVEA